MPSLQDAERRHAERFLKVLGEAQHLYLDGQQQTALMKFNSAWGQIQKAWNWSEVNYKDDTAARACLVLFPGQGGKLLSFRQHPKQYIHWLETGLSATQQVYEAGLEDALEIVGGYYNNLGIAYKNLGDSQKALKYQRLALDVAKKTKLDDAEAYALMAQGVIHKNLGKLDKAIVLHQKALALFRKNQNRDGEANALMNLGVTFYHQNKTTRSIECYEEAKQIFSQLNDQRGISKVFGNLGNAFEDAGDFQKAVNYHQQALSIARSFSDLQSQALALLNMGRCYSRLKSFNEALDIHEQSLKIFQEIGAEDGVGRAYWNISECLHNLDRTEDAIEVAKNALTAFKKINDPSVKAVQDYLLELHKHLAHSAVTHAIYTLQTNNDQTPEGYIQRGDAHKTLEQFDVALRYYDRAINLTPDHAEAYYKRGDAYFFLGRLDEAIDDFTYYLQLNPNSAMAYGKRGSIHMKLGHFDEALEDQKLAIEYDPKFVDAYYNVGVILEHRELLSEAVTYFEKAAELGDIESKTKILGINRKLQSYPQPISLNILQEIKTYSEMKRLVSRNNFLINDNTIANLREAIGQISQSGERNHLKRKFRWLQKAIRENNV